MKICDNQGWYSELHRDDLVVSIYASQAVSHGFRPQPGHTKDHHENCTNWLPALHSCIRVGVWQDVQGDCVKGQVVCGTVYGDMHYKDLLRSMVRVEYCILVPDFYLMLHGLWCRTVYQLCSGSDMLTWLNECSLCCDVHKPLIFIWNNLLIWYYSMHWYFHESWNINACYIIKSKENNECYLN